MTTIEPYTDAEIARAVDDWRPRPKDVDDVVVDDVQGEPLPAPTNPMQVSERLVGERFRHGDGALVLLHWRGGWWKWRTSHWSEVEHRDVRREAYRFTEHATYLKLEKDGTFTEHPWAPNRHRVADLLEAVQAVTYLPETVQPPAWIDGADGPAPGEIVACANGLLHVQAPRVLRQHDARFFNQVAVPFDFAPNAPSPDRWLRFLDELWPDDPDSIGALQEFFGYVISGRTDLHKILLLVGPTRAGKGVIARVLKALVGRANVAGPTLASLGQNFGLQDLIGKPLAIISDARLGRSDTNQVVERLLSVSGEDTLTIDRKYRDPWTGKLNTRFLLISNELPRFGDASGAIANRFVVMTMTTSWLGRENVALTEELMPDLPGILNWSLDGLDRLIRTNRFTAPRSSEDAILALQDLVSPVAAFVRDRCTVGPLREAPCAELYAAWKAWADDNGQRPGSVQTFGRDLRAVVPGLRTIRPRVDDDRERHFRGLALATQTHNGAGRGPERTNAEIQGVDRDGPRPNPLSVQVEQCSRCHRDDGPDNLIVVAGRHLHRDPAACRTNGAAIDTDTVEGRYLASIGELDR